MMAMYVQQTTVTLQQERSLIHKFQLMMVMHVQQTDVIRLVEYSTILSAPMMVMHVQQTDVIRLAEYSTIL